jgi:hypothetical protein
MATLKSDQLTNIEAVPAVQNPSRDEDARLRVKVFTWTATADVDPSTIRLGVLKKGYRLLGMRVTAPIIGDTGATLSLGVAGTVAKYMAATAIDAALSADANHTAALFHGEVLTEDVELIATLATADFTATGVLTVVVRYSRD